MKVVLRSLYKSKTMLFSMLLAIFGAIQATTGFLTTVMTPEMYGVFTMLVAVIIAILRFLTTVPLEEK